MDISELKQQFNQNDFEPESWQALQEVLAEIESSDQVSEDQLNRLSAVVDFEEQLENATIDAMEESAGNLEQRAEAINQTVQELTEEMNQLTDELEQTMGQNSV